MKSNGLEAVIRDALSGIKSLIEERYEIEQQLESVSQSLAHARAEIMTRVVSEKDENGKKRYSNEAEREAIALLLEDEDEDVRAMKHEVAKLLTKRRYIDQLVRYHELRVQAAIALIQAQGDDATCGRSSSTEGSAKGGESQSTPKSPTKRDLEEMRKRFWGLE